MHLIDIEVCSNCGRDIARSEQAYVFEGKIVCAECDNTLRGRQIVEPAEIPEPPAEQEPTTSVEPQFEEPDQSEPDEQEKGKQHQQENKHLGFIIVGIILCILGIFLTALGLLGLAVSLLAGVLIGILLSGWLLILSMLITTSGIAAIVIVSISRRRSPH